MIRGLKRKKAKKKTGPGQKSVRVSSQNLTIDQAFRLALKHFTAGQLLAAEEICRRIVGVAPNDVQTNCLYGVVARQLGKDELGLCLTRRVIRINPNIAEAHYNLGIIYAKQGLPAEAIKSYDRALAIKPAYIEAYDNKLLAMHYLDSLSPAEIYQAHQKFAERFETPLKSMWQHHANTLEPERRLKIGYVSPDFCRHSVGFFIEPILAEHDKSKVEIFCYYNHTQHDAVTDRIMASADHWVTCGGMSDNQLAARISADAIDVLVDLAGHTSDNRLLVFARKPAPVQVTWIGYPNTTGLTAMDFRLTDAQADPEGGTEQWHSEALFRLPHCFLCYGPPADCPEVSALSTLEKEQITFASFNNLTKINDAVLRAWADILHRVPAARLLIKGSVTIDQSLHERILQVFVRKGLKRERVHLLTRTKSFREHLLLYNNVHVALDTFPYNGATTTCEALWMGVPVISLMGKTHVARVGGSLLSTAGLDELIATDREDYIRIAVELASNKDRLGRMRQNMRARLRNSPLTDARGATRSLEDAYRTMWRIFCSSLSADAGA